MRECKSEKGRTASACMLSLKQVGLRSSITKRAQINSLLGRACSCAQGLRPEHEMNVWMMDKTEEGKQEDKEQERHEQAQHVCACMQICTHP